jgi:type I restriction enzyme S subunit
MTNGEWKTVRLSEFCRTGTGGTPSRSKLERYYEGGTIPWVKSGELREAVINETEEHVTEVALRETNVKLVPAGALLLAMYGATVGRLGILGVEATTNQAVCHIIPDPKAAEVRFLFHALSNQVANLVARGVGGAQPNISQGIIKDLKLALPPLAEQRRIAEILDQAEALRAKRRAALAELDSLTQSLFLDLFGDPTSQTQTIPIQSLESLLAQPLQNGAYYPKESYTEVGGVEMVHMSDAFYEVVPRGKLKRVICSESDVKKYALTVNDILIARRSLTIEGAAKPCLIPKSREPLIFESSFIRVTPHPDKITALYLYHYLGNDRVKQKCVQPYITQSTISGINQSNLERVPVIVPPLPLQREFARRVTAVEKLKAAQRVTLAEMDALFATLQHRAFQGEL